MKFKSLLIDFFYETFHLSGRLKVGRYWYLRFHHFFLALCIIIIIGSIFGFLHAFITSWIWFWYLMIVESFLRCRRLHDLNTSGWYTLPTMIFQNIPLLGLILWVYISFFSWKEWENTYGKNGEIEKQFLL